METRSKNKKTEVIRLSVKETSPKILVKSKDPQFSKGTTGKIRHSKITIDECMNFSEVVSTQGNETIGIEEISKEVVKQFRSERMESPDNLGKDNVCVTEAARARTTKNQRTTPDINLSFIRSSKEMRKSLKPTEKTTRGSIKTPVSVTPKHLAHTGIMLKFNPVKKTVPKPFGLSSNSKRLTRTQTEPALSNECERNPETEKEVAATETPHRREIKAALMKQNSNPIEKNSINPYGKTRSEANTGVSKAVPPKISAHSGIVLKSKPVKKTIPKPFECSSGSKRITRTKTEPAFRKARISKEYQLNTETTKVSAVKETLHPREMKAALMTQNSFISNEKPESEANPAGSKDVTVKKISPFGGLVFKPKRPLTHSRPDIFNNVQKRSETKT